MYRFALVLLAVSTALGVSVGTGHAASSLRDTLGERFKSPRFHVADYARVEVDREGRLKAGPDELALTKGT